MRAQREKQWLHLCKVVEVIPQRKLSYSWKHDGYEGDSKCFAYIAG